MVEYGGYLPLELPRGEEFYSGQSGVLRVNSGRTALYCALRQARPAKIYFPYYMCKSVQPVVECLGIETSYYCLDNDLSPLNISARGNEMVYWCNYFGTSSIKSIDKVVKTYESLIIDNAHAFFSSPVPSAYNIYSCRKFFGVADGAYLIGDCVKDEPIPEGFSFNRMQHLTKSLECGTNVAYPEYQESEASLDGCFTKMSKITQLLLQAVPYSSIVSIRNANFDVLHKKLREYNEICFETQPNAPICYPLLVTDKGLREHLLQNHVYVSTWWRHVSTATGNNSIEAILSDFLIPLPIDQRYDGNDMQIIANFVLDYLNKL